MDMVIMGALQKIESYFNTASSFCRYSEHRKCERSEKKQKELHSRVKKMGCKLDAPFIQISFLSPPVIPSLKITDKGLVDVDAFKIIPAVIRN